ncbi:MAG: hypothetical protein LBI99_02710 [Propionibacteriaceae bacterium]|nr:hypothetical protein [Propionibacteriaceae bacterium]
MIDLALQARPGGTVISPNEVVWPDGVKLVVAPDTQPNATKGAKATSSCASGNYCAHAGANGSGSRYEYSACPATYSVTTFQVSSVTNSRAAKNITVKRSTTTVASVKPGTTTNITRAYVSLTC